MQNCGINKAHDGDPMVATKADLRPHDDEHEENEPLSESESELNYGPGIPDEEEGAYDRFMNEMRTLGPPRFDIRVSAFGHFHELETKCADRNRWDGFVLL